jgi:hypothetical protein
LGILVGIRLSGQLLEVLPNELIDAGSKSLCAAAGTKNDFVVDGGVTFIYT